LFILTKLEQENKMLNQRLLAVGTAMTTIAVSVSSSYAGFENPKPEVSA
jgi:hypothetical protein